jgi:hypothetical protein
MVEPGPANAGTVNATAIATARMVTRLLMDVFSLALKLQQSPNSLSGNYVPRTPTLSWAETVMLSQTISNSGENHA